MKASIPNTNYGNSNTMSDTNGAIQSSHGAAKTIKQEPSDSSQHQQMNNTENHPTLADAEEFLERMRRTMLQQSKSHHGDVDPQSESYSPPTEDNDSNDENVLELKVPRSVKRIIVVRDGKRKHFDLD